MSDQREDRAESYFRWAVRTLGILSFVTLLALFVAGREIPTAWIVLTGGMLGLDPIINYAGKKADQQ